MRLASTLLFLLSVAKASATEPQTFELHYQARYGNFAASAERSLLKSAESDLWQLRSTVAVELLGRTLSRIDETSRFKWQDDSPRSHDYLFQQQGVGSRSRSLVFVEDGSSTNFRVNDRGGSIPLSETTFDLLNSSLALRSRLAKGETEIALAVIDGDELTTHHYHVVAEETLALPAGSFTTLHLERVRAEDSDRHTDLWLARDHDYVLVKLLQTETDKETVTLELSSGRLGNRELTAVNSPSPQQADLLSP